MHTTTIIRAELGGNTCTAMGITATGCAPIPATCRALLAAGIDPSWPLLVFRDGILALRVRSIGEGARLRVHGDGHGFAIAPAETRPAAPLVRQSPPMDAVAWLAKLRRRQRQRRLHHQKCAAAARERKRLRKQRGLL